jgi:hypothetical protein
MDPIKILKRAWKILWSYRALWVFGIILALTTASGSGGGGGGSGGDYDGANGGFHGEPELVMPAPEDMAREFDQMLEIFSDQINVPVADWITLLWFGVIFVIILIILGVVGMILRFVAETALIRMVDEHERSGEKPGVRQGFRMGWSRSAWRLFWINFLTNLPVFFLVLFGLLLGIGVFLLAIQDNIGMSIAGIVGGIGIFFLVIFTGVILGAALNLLKDFAWRASALEEIGVMEGFRQGFGMVRHNLKDVAVMWLIMVGLGILWVIGFILITILLIPLLLVTILAGVVAGSVPALIMAGISSLFLHGPLPWVVGVMAGLPLFALVAFSPLIFLTALEKVFSSSVWTLVYRELKALKELAIAPEPEPLPAGTTSE